MDIHLNAKSIKQEDGDLYSADVIVCQNDQCTPVRVTSKSKVASTSFFLHKTDRPFPRQRLRKRPRQRCENSSKTKKSAN
jgi:hypothetical protein